MGRGAERWLRVAMAEQAEEEDLPVPGESGDGPLRPLLPAGGGTRTRTRTRTPTPRSAGALPGRPSGLPAVSAVCCRPVRGGRGNAAVRVSLGLPRFLAGVKQ